MSERLMGTFREAVVIAWRLTRATGRELATHWVLALLSLASAGVIWFTIQEIENPRIEATVPGEENQGIPVEFVNLDPRYVASEIARVRVRVEAREADIPDLQAADFRAVVDLQGVGAGTTVSRTVQVTSLADSVTVLAVEPPQIFVQLVEVEEREFEVHVNLTGQLPSGFDEPKPPVIDPAFVTVRGRADVVKNVDRVEIDVNLSGQRQPFNVKGELIARNRNGDRQVVAILPSVATVSFTLGPSLASKSLPVHPAVTGLLAPGYQVTNISSNPLTVTGSGRATDLANLTEVRPETLDVSGASTTVTQTRRLPTLSGVTFDRDSVVVVVRIDPIQCGTTNPVSACGAATFSVAPQFRDVPAGLAVDQGNYRVLVRLSGPLSAAGTLDPGTVVAIVSLSGATAGEASYTANVVVQSPHRIEKVEPISVKLVQVNQP